MRIIKQGKLPNVVMHGTCRRCGTRIECDPSEVQYNHDPRPGDSCYTVPCPLSGCGYSIVVAPKLQQLGSSQCHRLLTKLHDVGLTSEEEIKLKEALSRIFDTLNEEVVD